MYNGGQIVSEDECTESLQWRLGDQKVVVVLFMSMVIITQITSIMTAPPPPFKSSTKWLVGWLNRSMYTGYISQRHKGKPQSPKGGHLPSSIGILALVEQVLQRVHTQLISINWQQNISRHAANFHLTIFLSCDIRQATNFETKLNFKGMSCTFGGPLLLIMLSTNVGSRRNHRLLPCDPPVTFLIIL